MMCCESLHLVNLYPLTVSPISLILSSHQGFGQPSLQPSLQDCLEALRTSSLIGFFARNIGAEAKSRRSIPVHLSQGVPKVPTTTKNQLWPRLLRRLPKDSVPYLVLLRSTAFDDPMDLRPKTIPKWIPMTVQGL
uniref:Uncharacterized protein n=1 Tax=Steinernema glaseri TaxID=37863 RepID=A0A1I7YLJ3_9BILA